MYIVHSDTVSPVTPGTVPDYNAKNPLFKVLGLIEKTQLAVEREYYMMESVQYLFSVAHVELYGPSAPNQDVLDATQQDGKTDFQKQNVRDFLTGATHLVRGWINTGTWTTPFLRLSYHAGPDSAIWKALGGPPGDRIKLWIKVSDVAAPITLTVPYNETSKRYEVELWGTTSASLREQLDTKGRAALDRGELQLRGDLVRGLLSDFDREGLNDKFMGEVAAHSTMHPLLPLHIELAWADIDETVWDSNGGNNYHYEFNMDLRGWRNFLATGFSSNPHGGVGTLEYRNLFSNYFHPRRGELGRNLEAWSFNAKGRKGDGERHEEFLTVDYMDWHILHGNSGIGIHRHRDNQEVFLVMEGQGFMVVGDWCQFPHRERCLEVRTMRTGDLTVCKTGQLHGLMNATDEAMLLFMFGGYD